ncbi:MAG: deoxyribose-phosphate aldolase [Bryobacteraceae bacterium]
MHEIIEHKPEPAKYEDLAQMMEQSLVAPELSESDVAAGCELAKQYGIAAVLVRPSDLDLVVNWLRGSQVVLGAVIDAPYGYSTTAAKLFAARDALRRGAKEIDTVMNTGKLVSRQFQYLETELLQMADACHGSGALLKVALESERLNEELKIVACRIAKRTGADYLASSTMEDVALLKSYAREKVKLACTLNLDSLDTALGFREAGCSRLQSANPGSVLKAWKLKLGVAQAFLPACPQAGVALR